jgi:predicted transcriptional regulator/DNA-binding XRE family transcriptional regulator
VAAGKIFDARPHPKYLDSLHVGERLKEIRNVAGVTQNELAARLKIGQTALSKLEKRTDIHVSTLRNYIEALGATLRIDARFDSSDTLIRCLKEASVSFEQIDENQLLLPIFEEEAFSTRRDVVFSIKPTYCEKILDGTKTVELRRRFPLNVPSGTMALIYATTPLRAVVGVAEIDEVLQGSPSSIWASFEKEACITKPDFETYFHGVDKGYVIKLSNSVQFKRRIELSELRERFNFEPPQSYLYATPQLREALLNEFAQFSN